MYQFLIKRKILSEECWPKITFEELDGSNYLELKLMTMGTMFKWKNFVMIKTKAVPKVKNNFHPFSVLQIFNHQPQPLI